MKNSTTTSFSIFVFLPKPICPSHFKIFRDDFVLQFLRVLLKVIDYSRDHTIEEGLEWINMWNASMLSQSELMEGFRSYKDKTEGNFAELPKLKDHFSKK